jgi:hypothetical protein
MERWFDEAEMNTFPEIVLYLVRELPLRPLFLWSIHTEQSLPRPTRELPSSSFFFLFFSTFLLLFVATYHELTFIIILGWGKTRQSGGWPSSILRRRPSSCRCSWGPVLRSQRKDSRERATTICGNRRSNRAEPGIPGGHNRPNPRNRARRRERGEWVLFGMHVLKNR